MIFLIRTLNRQTANQVPTIPGSSSYTGSPIANKGNLTTNTTYYIHIRTVCGNNDSFFLVTRSFTIATCDTPTNIGVSNITSSGADINWPAVTNAVEYEYVIDQVATNPVSEQL